MPSISSQRITQLRLFRIVFAQVAGVTAATTTARAMHHRAEYNTESIVFEKRGGHILILKSEKNNVERFLESALTQLSHPLDHFVLVLCIIVDRVGQRALLIVFGTTAAAKLKHAATMIRMHQRPEASLLQHLLGRDTTHVHGMTSSVQLEQLLGIVDKLQVRDHQVRICLSEMLVD